MMTEYAFFEGKVERWSGDMAALWGNFTICPCLNHIDLSHHLSMELASMSSFKVWGDIQEPCQDIAYLLVRTGDTIVDRSYRVSLVWVSPNQARPSTMEEVVETLSTCPSSGTVWPYILA